MSKDLIKYLDSTNYGIENLANGMTALIFIFGIVVIMGGLYALIRLTNANARDKQIDRIERAVRESYELMNEINENLPVLLQKQAK